MLLWNARQTPRIIQRWKAGTPKASGIYDLPSWLAYSCATGNTTAQTGPSTVRSGFPANRPRAFSRNGSTWGWLVEGPTTNEFGADQDLDVDWTKSGTPTVVDAALPTGALQKCEVADDTGGATEFLRLIQSPADATYTLSLWRHVVAISGSSVHSIFVRDGVGTAFCVISGSSTDSGWSYLSSTEAVVGMTEARLVPASVAGDTGTYRAGLLQFEAALSPSSFIDGSRAAGIVSLPDPTQLFPGGHYDIEMVLAPTFASTEHGGFTLVFWDSAIGAQDGITVSGSNQLDVIHNGSVRFSAPALSWSRDQELYIRASVGPSGSRLKLAGFTTGNGEATAPGTTGVVPLPATAYLLGGPTGPSQGRNFALREIIFRQPL